MSYKFKTVIFFAGAATLLNVAFSPLGAGVAAQDRAPIMVQPSQSAVEAAPAPADPATSSDQTASQPASLAELVDIQPKPETLSRDMECLAGAIYFESKSESLAGQLAVGRVVVDRTKSGRFPASYCGVVFQRSQFSFVRGNRMPAIPKASRNWQNAVAIAQIADNGRWDSPTEGALYFHAAHVSPRWRMTRIARVDDHIFYR